MSSILCVYIYFVHGYEADSRSVHDRKTRVNKHYVNKKKRKKRSTSMERKRRETGVIIGTGRRTKTLLGQMMSRTTICQAGN